MSTQDDPYEAMLEALKKALTGQTDEPGATLSTMLVDSVDFGVGRQATGAHARQPSTVAVLRGRRLPHGQPVAVVCDVREARPIAEAVARDTERETHGHSHVRATYGHWQVVGQN